MCSGLPLAISSAKLVAVGEGQTALLAKPFPLGMFVKTPSRSAQIAWWFGWLLTAALLAGALYAVWGLVTADAGTPLAGCDAITGADCEAVLGSPWAWWVSVPVSRIGLALYGAFAVGWLLAPTGGPIGRFGWRLTDVCVPAALGGAAWFVGVQAVAIGHWCVWCLMVHGCGGAAALLAMLLRHAASQQTSTGPSALARVLMPQAPGRGARRTQWFTGPPGLGVPTALGVLGLVALIGGQLFFPVARFQVSTDVPQDLAFNLDASPETSEPAVAPSERFDTQPTEGIVEDDGTAADADRFTPPQIPAGPPRKPLGERTIEILDGKLRLNTYDHPILGSPEAEYVIVEVMDYACSQCRKTQPLIDEALRRFDGRVAVVVLPWPTDVLCNKYVKKPKPEGRGSCKTVQLAIAVARADPEAFAAFHAWMAHNPDEAPKFLSSRIAAERFVNVDELRRAFDDSKTEQLRNQYIELYAQLARGRTLRLPCQIVGSSIVSGAPDTVEELVKVWEENLGIEASKGP